MQNSTLADGLDINKLPDKSVTDKEKQLLEKFSPVLNAFLNGNLDLQLIAIYALQVYGFSVNFPKGKLKRLEAATLITLHLWANTAHFGFSR